MGAVCCKAEEDEIPDPAFGGRVKSWKRQNWRSEEPITTSQLQTMRETFWDTEPHYGGDRVIWDALRAACEADLGTARAILEGAGVIVAAPDCSICYDEQGRKYELPRFVLSDPTNLLPEPGGKAGQSLRTGGGSGGGGGTQVELPAVAGGGGGGGGAAGSPSSPDSAGMQESAPLNQVAVR